jgi:3-dehydroquinate synthase
LRLIKTITTEFDDSPYSILIGRNIISNVVTYLQERTNNKKVIIVTDSFFKDTLAAKVSTLLAESNYEVFMYSMDAGKGNKNINEVMKIYGILEENNLARDSTLIAIGGGVIGDLSGFIASTWLRGMNLVHIPTTLMGMVDSSVGGKVAINFRQTINAIGNYYHPILNLMDLDLVDTLPEREYKSGIAEVIKCSIINDAELFKYLKKECNAILDRSEEQVVHFISRALEIKIDHVQGDTREGGKRLLLNYGHTLGHSVEISTEKNYQEQYRHGEGVSIGIMAAAYIAEKYLDTPSELYESYKKLFHAYGLPTEVNTSELGFERHKLLSKCLRNVNKDKKRLNNNLRIILADKIGHASVYNDVPFSIVEDAFSFIIK